ncbi:Clp protease N-terminal domain-containing protein [Streptomyces olivaceoviridis]|uniref:Clp protease N-terminal domain-containing protein n=1 Tax=Streptomyces olivaceoviridis TaxID=1921 RepID=UPI00167B695B|nr:Clp protease N-terminal domain-containing protein [Streptomyces olivaceoviridis]
MVSAARRRAVRDRDRHTDTAHLLHALLEHDPEARAAVGGPQRLARVLGYLVQRSIGYGLRWQSRVEDSGAMPLVPAPAGPVDAARLAGPVDAARLAGSADAARLAGPAGPVGPAGPGGPGKDAEGWSPAASAALADARARARRRGAPRVGGTDLLAALAADPRSRAVEVLERAGVPARELAARIDAGADVYADDDGAAR